MYHRPRSTDTLSRVCAKTASIIFLNLSYLSCQIKLVIIQYNYYTEKCLYWLP